MDTCFIQGDFIKVAREYKKEKNQKKNYNIEIKTNRRLGDILDAGAILYITPITKYQILENLVFSERLQFEEAKNVFLAVVNKYQNMIEIKCIDKDILSDERIFRALSKMHHVRKIELHDVLNIEIACQAEMPIITSEERKISSWKLIYEKVWSQEEAWKNFRKGT